ncbi:MAG: PEP-CTERM sorting domain-containing protein [Opitutus sp.]|nr:PEP-CTERM sorting domain-containing protein [Opitutus sp.]
MDAENSRVLRFSEDGDFLNSFEIASDSQSFEVSDSGFLFVATNSSENIRDGYIYDALTGSFVGTFDLPEDYDEFANQGRGAMTFYDGELVVISPSGSQFHTYDISGFAAIPEPSTYAALLGGGAFGVRLLAASTGQDHLQLSSYVVPLSLDETLRLLRRACLCPAHRAGAGRTHSQRIRGRESWVLLHLKHP